MKPKIILGHHPVSPSSLIRSNDNLRFINDLEEWYLAFYKNHTRAYNKIHDTLNSLIVSDNEHIKRNPKYPQEFHDNLKDWKQSHFDSFILKNIFESIFKFELWKSDNDPAVRSELELKRFKSEFDTSINSLKQLSRIFKACPHQAGHLGATLFQRLKKNKNISIGQVDFHDGVLIKDMMNDILEEFSFLLKEAKKGNVHETNVDIRHDWLPMGAGIKLSHSYLALTAPKANFASRQPPSNVTVLTILISFYISSYREYRTSKLSRASTVGLKALMNSFDQNYLKESAVVALCGLVKNNPPSEIDIKKVMDNTRKYISRNPNILINKGMPNLSALKYSD